MEEEKYKVIVEEKLKKSEQKTRKERIEVFERKFKSLLKRSGFEHLVGFSQDKPKDKYSHWLLRIPDGEEKKDTLFISFGASADCDCEYCKEARWRKEWRN